MRAEKSVTERREGVRKTERRCSSNEYGDRRREGGERVGDWTGWEEREKRWNNRRIKKRRVIGGNRERESRRKGKSDGSMEGFKTRIEPGGGIQEGARDWTGDAELGSI